MELGFISDGRTTDPAFARSVGFDSLEIAFFGPNPLLADSRELESALLDQSMPIASVSLFGQNYFGADAAERRALLDQCLAFAQRVNARSFVFGTGSAPSMGAAVQRLSPVAEAALQSGIKPAFYNCQWENISWGVAAFHELEGTPFGIKFDPSHPVQNGRDWRPELLASGSRLVHAHAKDVLRVGNDFLPDPNPGLGDIAWTSFYGILNHIGFDGCVCIEPHSPLYYGDRRDEFLRLSYRYLRQFYV